VDAGSLLGLPVRLNGIELGRPVDLILDQEGRQAVGLEVRCGDGGRRFLPLKTVHVHDDHISVNSVFALLNAGELRFYRERGVSLQRLRAETPGLELDLDGGFAVVASPGSTR
jgi:hypothetical protein